MKNIVQQLIPFIQLMIKEDQRKHDLAFGDFLHLNEKFERRVGWIYDLEKGRVERPM